MHTKKLYDEASPERRRQLGPYRPTEYSGRWDWDGLRERVKKHGMRNSLLTACMPTASTSQILGYSECMEPLASMCLKRITLSGEFQVVCSYLLRDLYRLGLWNSEMKDRMFANDGSIQNIPGIPAELKELYKTVWEIKQRSLIDLSADRARWIDQTQSLNLFFDKVTYDKMTSALFYGWRKGLKTGIYYARMRAAKALQFTVEQGKAAAAAAEKPAVEAEEPAVAVPVAPVALSALEPPNLGPMKLSEIVEEDEPIPEEDDGLGEVVMACSMQEGCQSCSA